MAKVSIVMPVLNGEQYIGEAIDSIIAQTFTDWEFIIIVEYGSSVESIEILSRYEKQDKRVRMIKNDTNLGISKSLNRGIDIANGEYIARMDADDIAFPTRLERQVSYMDEHPEVGLLGTDFQVKGANWKSNLVIGRENIKADLLFHVCLRHPTVMYRKSVLDANNLRYSTEYAAAEDYELFTRFQEVSIIENLPEVLVVYRRHSGAAVNQRLYQSAHVCRIVAKRMLKKLEIDLPDNDIELLYNHCLLEWNYTDYNQGIVESFAHLEELLNLIDKKNRNLHIYNYKSLQKVLEKRLLRAKQMADKCAVSIEKEKIQKIYSRSKYGMRISSIDYITSKLKSSVKNILRRFAKPVVDSVNKVVERWTWERYKRINKDLEQIKKETVELKNLIVSDLYKKNRVPYRKGEKIRIVFLYQVASFWPSWESLYNKLVRDDRFDVVLLYLNETVSETSQMIGAEEFIAKKGIDYERYEEFDLEMYNPHILVMQTPYDHYHRKSVHHSSIYKSQGYRIVYIPYGIEITDTTTSRHDQYEQAVELNAWRIYTFSSIMLRDYHKYCVNGHHARGLGIPRFDSLYEKKIYPLSLEIKNRVKKRKIVLWKVHFPKVTSENGKNILITPDLSEYYKFSKKLKEYSNLFFVFLPHPKFQDSTINAKIRIDIQKIFENLKASENVWIDFADDYRSSLMNSDYIIIDRSAVMIEAAITEAPILYMSNPNYFEVLNDAVEPLVSSYYQGVTCEDMTSFLDMCLRGEDPKRDERLLQTRNCLPTFDGHCTDRIIEDMISGLEGE